MAAQFSRGKLAPPILATNRALLRKTAMKRVLVGIAALACIANDDAAPPQPELADITGIYSGSSFETYMGMEIAADGTFGWEMSVGGLDLRSRGVWEVRDGVVHFTTRPTPVPPEFRFVRIEAGDEPAEQILQVNVTGPRGRPFTNADTLIECANGARIYDFVAGSGAYRDGYSPEDCDTPVAVTIEQSNYNITSPRYDLAALGWKPGQALHLEFVPNDIGVFDLTGMHGTFADGILAVDGPLGVVDFRKVGDPAPLGPSPP
jgi:hypothetical protein